MVIAHAPIAAARRSGGKIRSNSVWVNGISGPPQNPCPMRNATISPSVGASPHSAEKAAKPIIAAMNTRTVPNRRTSQPVSGTQIASATE